MKISTILLLFQSYNVVLMTPPSIPFNCLRKKVAVRQVSLKTTRSLVSLCTECAMHLNHSGTTLLARGKGTTMLMLSWREICSRTLTT